MTPSYSLIFLELAEFNSSKVNQNIRNKFEESNENTEKLKVIRQPKKKIISLDQILLKVLFKTEIKQK